MLDWIADSKTLLGLSVLFTLSGINIISVYKYLSKISENPKEQNENQKSDTEKSLTNVPSKKDTSTNFKRSNSNNRLKKLHNAGYSVYKGSYLKRENDAFTDIIAAQGIFTLLAAVFFLLFLLISEPENTIGMIIFVIFLVVSLIFALWLSNKQYFVINNETGSLYHFNRGVFHKLKSATVNNNIEQIDKDIWTPRILLNNLIITEGSPVTGKKEALDYFRDDAKVLSQEIDGKLINSWDEWRDWIKKARGFKSNLINKFTKT